MSWDGQKFSPGGGQLRQMGMSSGGTGNYVTVQDLISLGIIDPGAMSAGGTLFSGATVRLTDAVHIAMANAQASIEMNSSTLFKKMNGLAGMVIGSGGLAGYDATGTATITINPADGSVTLTGTITATAGAIGGFTIGADYIRDAADSFGLASTVTGGDDVRFWAGDTFANRATAGVRVYESGSVYIAGVTATTRLTVVNSSTGVAADISANSGNALVVSGAPTGTNSVVQINRTSGTQYALDVKSGPIHVTDITASRLVGIDANNIFVPNNTAIVLVAGYTPISTTIVGYIHVTLPDGTNSVGLPYVAYP